MIGQVNLLKKLNSYTIDNFPHSSLILGEEGSGKHTLSMYIKDNILKLPLLDITENISDEYIDMIYRNPNPSIYLINMSKMMEKEQNILLKFIEEPLQNAFIILLCENVNNLLNTIYNRCVVFEMELYKLMGNKFTKEELRLIFIVSDVELVTSSVGNDYEVTSTLVEHHTGCKCERCWNFFSSLEEVEGFKVCSRCKEVLING